MIDSDSKNLYSVSPDWEHYEEFINHDNRYGSYINEKYFKYIKKPIENVVILGCNFNTYTEPILEVYKPEKIYAFEADPDLAERCINNPVEKTVYTHAAVYDKDEPVEFYPSDDKGQGSLYERYNGKDNPHNPSGNEIQNEKIVVPGIRLDTFFSSTPDIEIDLLCMDIQGAELPALKGLGSMLENVSYIIAEIPKRDEFNYHYNDYTVSDIYSFLELAGFSAVEKDEENDIEDNVFFVRN